jgi:hypothetical protein
MGSKNWTNHLTCLNCGSRVHWTTFQCHVCGRNPRERESFETKTTRENQAAGITERRKHPRCEFEGTVILNGLSRGEFVDLSPQGAKLKTPLKLFRDEVVYLDFTVKGIPIRVRARVIHVKRGVLDDRFTLGVCFEGMAEDQSEILSYHLYTVSEEKAYPRYFA